MQERKNALDILLRHSLPEAVEHLEAIVSALMCTMDAKSKNKFVAALNGLEPSELTLVDSGITIQDISRREIVQLQGEGINETEKSERQLWSAERKALVAKLAELEETESLD